MKDKSPYTPPKTAEELLQRYAAGERVFHGVELDTPDSEGNYPSLDGTDLSSIVFRESWLTVSFRGCDLRKARFEGNVKTCDFDGADLRGGNFAGSGIEGASFRGANLEGTNFVGAYYMGFVIDDNESWIAGLPDDSGTGKRDT